MLLFHHLCLVIKSIGEQSGCSQDRIDNELLVGWKQTFEFQMEQRFLITVTILSFMR